MNVTNSTCYTNPNAPKAEMGFDKWLYAAYVCILFSYVNVNILVFRFWLIMGAVFFVCWALDPVRAIQLDSLMFNLAFIVINIIMCIPLVRQIWPVKLTSDEERIFNRDFQSNMNIRQFKRLIKEFERKNFNLDKSQLCVIGSDFKHLVYISDIYPGWKVSIYDKDGVKLQELEEGSWLGTIEYVNYEKNKTANIYWDVTCVLEEITQFQDPYQQTEQNLIPGTGCDVYFFDLKVCLFIILFYIVDPCEKIQRLCVSYVLQKCSSGYLARLHHQICDQARY